MNIDRTNQCGYCLSKVIGENKLLCLDCKRYIHIQCLKRPGTPGDFIGDVFFKFQCSNCTVDGKEDFNRIQLPWSMIIVMAIHNLSIQSKGLSHHGFFHWRRHISHFIEKNWQFLFVPGVKKKKNWIGTISGSLSHNTPDIFASGFDVFQESGWWKLTHKYSPKQYLQLCGTSSKKRKLVNDDGVDDNKELNQPTTSTFVMNAQTPTTDGSELLSVDSSDDLMLSEKKFNQDDDSSMSFSRTIPFMGRPPRMNISQQTSLNNQLDLDTFLASNVLPSIMPLDTIQLSNETTSIPPINSITPLTNLPDDLFDTNDSAKELSLSIVYNQNSNRTNSQANQPRIIQVINYQETSASSSEESTNDDDDDDVADADEDEEIDCTNDLKVQISIENKMTTKLIDEDEEYSVKFPCKPSLFSRSIKLTNQKPWENKEKTTNEIQTDIDIPSTAKIVLASVYEEKEMFLKLKSIITDYDKKNMTKTIEIPAFVRRFYRKLYLRNENRMLGKPVFDLDNLLGNGVIGNNSEQNNKQTKSNVLDRYYHQLIISSAAKIKPTIQSNLAGISEFELFESPHTKRILHPFVYRNKKTFPPWLKLMCELQYTVNNGKMPLRGTIDYCYVRPQHIAAVNSLLQRMFWSGIDMSECLSYPDFSIVALYKKLVIGCAFLVPDVNDNDAYVSFMAVRPGWQRAGIASFMLYHLTQTCMGKDITLHVSANNSAICLYQKFGFKIEEVILDFYEKYLPLDTKESRHAFFLRLKR